MDRCVRGECWVQSAWSQWSPAWGWRTELWCRTEPKIGPLGRSFPNVRATAGCGR